MRYCNHCGEEICEGQDYYPYSYNEDYCCAECMIAHAKNGADELIEELFWDAWWQGKKTAD